MATFYTFRFKCLKCDKQTFLRFRVPKSGTESLLSCKSCESPILSIYAVEFDSGWRYAVSDLIRNKTILGGRSASQADSMASRDTFYNWIIDHDGNRLVE